MTGQEWLERVFAPAMRTGAPPMEELASALEALRDCGVLSEQEAARAASAFEPYREQSRRLQQQRLIELHRRRIGRPGSQGAPPDDRLQVLLEPGRPLADVDGITVVVLQVEIWARKLLVHLAAAENAITGELDDQYRAAFSQWEAGLPPRGERDDYAWPPQMPGEVLADLPLAVSDDVDTRYVSLKRMSAGGHSPWRATWTFEPGVPQTARRLVVAMEGADAQRQAVDLPLPARSADGERADL